MSSRLLSTSVALVFIAGCGGSTETTHIASQPTPALVEKIAPATQPVVTSPDRAQALADATGTYAQQMQDHLAQRRTRPEPTTRPAAVPIPQIAWIEDRSWSLNLAPPQDTAASARAKTDEPAAPTTQPAPNIAPNTQIAAIDITNTGVVTVKPDSLKPAPLPDVLETKVSRAARDYPRDLSPQLDYQLLQFISGKDVPLQESIAQLPPDDRELVSAVLDSLTNLRATAKNDLNLPLAKKARPLLDAAERLRGQVGLNIPTIALCSRVEGFGVYEPIASNRFAAGREHAVVVYCEIENFASRSNERGLWETALTQEVVIYGGNNKLASEKQQPVTDLSRNRRRDFFVGRRVKLPASLPPGNYSIRVTIRDQQANRVAEATTAVEIVADVK